MDPMKEFWARSGSKDYTLRTAGLADNVCNITEAKVLRLSFLDSERYRDE